MKKIYNVAIIGCGGMGEAHIQENYYKDNIRFTYACDCDLERAAMFQRKYGVDYSPVIIRSAYQMTMWTLSLLLPDLKATRHTACLYSIS